MSVVKQGMKAKDELVFISTIAKMGDKNRIIWIPAALHEMIKDYEDKKIKVRITRAE